MKTESQLVIFYFCFYSLSLVFNDMVSKRTKVYVCCLYTQIKYKGITGHIRNKKMERCLHHKGTLCFKYVSKE